jgi:DNA-binding LacI/PurR family transcriptional regulator/DNA-binding transcriptional regulator YhcF (GntR family)
MEAKPIPFNLDRTCSISFSEQLAAGLRDAIRIGYYPAGAVLPSKTAMAKSLGVSEIVVRTAYRKLSDEGIVVSRPRIGTVVQPPRAPVWRGHVLCVMTDHDFNFRLNSIVEMLRFQLTREGFLFSQVQILYERNGKPDFTAFDYSIKRSVDFVVLAFGDVTIERHLSQNGIPYAVLDGAWHGMKGCVGCLQFYYRKATEDFVKHCIAAKIRRVEIVCCNRKHPLCDPVGESLSHAGIAVSFSCVPSDSHFRRLEEVAKSGASFVRKVLGRKRRDAPELFFIMDDYLAAGFLAETVSMKINIPDDIRVVCCVTEGNRPYFGVSLAGFSIDPDEVGRLFADKLLAYLGHRRPFPNIVVDAAYVRGESFP